MRYSSLFFCVLFFLCTHLLRAEFHFSENKIIVSNPADLPTSVTCLDIDNDGDLDLVSSSFNDNKIAWYENKGNGYFGEQNIISNNVDGAYCIISSDIDNDGNLDLVSASFSNDRIVWHKNNGNEEFSEINTITQLADGVMSIFAADINADGNMDIISASSSDNKIAWYKNLGYGNFTTQNIISTSADKAKSVFAGDIDNDGDIDVIAASYNDNSIRWYSNIGDDNFSSEHLISDEVAGAICVRVDDLDNDGDLDAIVASYDDDKIIWYENDGSGNFNSEYIISDNVGGARYVNSSDIDNDGDLDVVSASFDNDKVYWHENDGSGNFISQNIISKYVDGARFLYTVDIDNDNQTDVISTSENDDKIAWYKNNNGTFDYQQIINESADLPYSVATGDLDDDGDSDIVISSLTPAKITWCENSGNGNFSKLKGLASHAAKKIYIVDINNDKYNDILYHQYSGDNALYWLQNSGNGSFSDPILIKDNIVCFYPADIDKDNNIDIVLREEYLRTIQAWYNTGKGFFNYMHYVATPPFLVGSLYVEDMNNDGKLDVLASAENSAYLCWCRNRQYPLFYDPTIIYNSGRSLKEIISCDLNSDGHMDVLAVTNEYHGHKIVWFENKGLGTFYGYQEIATHNSASLQALKCCDFDEDNDIDIFAAFSAEPYLSYIENFGDKNFSSMQQIINYSINSIDIGDLDNDGDRDLLSAVGENDKILWHVNGSTPAAISPNADFEANPISSVLPGGNIFFTAEYNDDVIFWQWDFGNSLSTTTSSKYFNYIYETSGLFTIKYNVFNASSSTIVEKENYILILPFNPPEFSCNLFTEDFESNLSDLWQFNNSNHWQVQENNNSIYINTSNYSASENDKLGEYAIINQNINEDFTFQFGAKSLEDISINTNADYCGIFGYIDDNNYYYFMFNVAFMETALYEIKDSQRTLIQNRYGNWIQDSDWHDIQMTCQDSAVWIYYDSTAVLYVENINTDGKVGIGSYNDAAMFDDVQILVESDPFNMPVANFYADTTWGIDSLTVQFTDSSTGDITNWSWDFDDGSISTEQHPRHTFLKDDTFSVKLTVNGPVGSDSLIREDYIIVAPHFIISIPEISFYEDDTLFISESDFEPWIQYLQHGFADLTFEVMAQSSSLNSSMNNTVLIVWAEPNWCGRGYVVVKISDPENRSTTDTMYVNVQPVNDSPGLFDLFLPANFSEISNTMVQFAWQASYNWDFLSNDTINYTVYLGLEGSTLDSIAAIADTTLLFDMSSFSSGCYQWKVKATDLCGDTCWSINQFEFEYSNLSNIDNLLNSKPDKFQLYQNYPNPFNPSTKICYAVKEACHVHLSVYNLKGQIIKTLIDAHQESGHYSLDFNMIELPSGIYFYRIRMNNFSDVKKMMKLE